MINKKKEWRTCSRLTSGAKRCFTNSSSYRRVNRKSKGLDEVLVAKLIDREQFVTEEIIEEGNRWPNIEASQVSIAEYMSFYCWLKILLLMKIGENNLIIVNGDAPTTIALVSGGAEAAIPPKTTVKKIARRNELKAKSTLLLAIPDEHLLKIHGIKDAKTLWEEIKTRFEGNKESKKIQKTILKQQYENFIASRSEGLDKIYDRFQKLTSQLEIHDHTSSTNEAINTNHSVSVASSQGQASTSTYANDVMFSFFVNQSNSPQLENEDLEQINTDDLEEMDLKWQVAMLTMRVMRFINNSRRNINFNGKETFGFDKTKVECYNCHRRGHFARECRAPRSHGNKNGDTTRRVVPAETPINSLIPSYVFKSASDGSVNEIEEDNNQANDRFKVAEGYHAAPPSYTRNFMPSRPDLSLAGLDDSIFKSAISEPITSVHKTKTSTSNTSKESIEKPKTVRPSALIIEYWESNSVMTRPTRNVIDHISKDSGSYMVKRFNYVDLQGRLKHMKRNKTFLTDYQKIDEGFIAFGGSPKGGKISRKDHLGKFERKADEGFLVGYFVNSKAFRSPDDKDAGDVPDKGDECVNKGSSIDDQEKTDSDTQNVGTTEPSINTADTNINIVGPNDPSKPSLEETGIFNDVYDDREVGAEAGTNNLELSIVVDLFNGKRAIGTKWVFRNKKDERGIVIRNKAKLVKQGYTQEEGINYDEVFAPVARIEAIRIFLAYASFMRFIVYQIDIKSTFLYGTIEEEVHVCQPPGFKDPHFSNKDYKVEKALYGLHQAPRACYKTLSTYLLENRFRKETIGKTLFIKKERNNILLVQVYVDDIIFGSTKKSLWDEFEQMMHKRFQMSSMGELTFFLGFQVKEKDNGIFISQTNSPFDLEAFSDSDYAGASLDRKSTIGGCQFLGKRLISWKCKKQTIVLNFSTEAEYVATASCCRQVLWIQNQMLEYGFNLMNTKIYIDNESKICIVKTQCFTLKPSTWKLGEQTPLFPTMLAIQAEEGKDSRHPSKPQPPSSSAQPIHEEQIPTIVSSTHQKTQTSRQALNKDTELSQTSVPIYNVPDEAVFEEELVQVAVLSAETTRGSIDQTRPERVHTPPHDSPLLRVNTLRSDEGSMSIQELTALCTTLSDRVLSLETDLRQTKKVYGTAYIKLVIKVKKLEKTVKSNQARRRTKIMISDDEEDSEDSSK
uniref:Putative ribonuclease H-like domain-containing protein n=1 Tax=Tanacetum cinerariifolium TaxID=118510 RepID=A0A699GT02_TANCI|nr:putative ribonuclease H-like domain-containing protein [Tanacetum cinerariifolium]